MPDTIQTLECGSIIQHGKQNDRIYLMKAASKNTEALPQTLKKMAQQQGYSKIFAKVPAPQADAFLNAGYQTEARVPGFYNATTEALMLGLYLVPERVKEDCRQEYDEITRLALSKAGAQMPPLPQNFRLRQCNPEDASCMAKIYKKVFASYPFAIDDPRYLRQTMASHVDYFCAEHINGSKTTMVALSSAEKDVAAHNAEMTDFATLPDWLGHSLALHLLNYMQNHPATRNIRTFYTIARAISPGMNITFAKAGYRFCGRLKNNTNISGSIESMNVWHKTI